MVGLDDLRGLFQPMSLCFVSCSCGKYQLAFFFFF